MIKERLECLQKYGYGRRVSTWMVLGVIILSLGWVLSGCGSDSGSPQAQTKKKLADRKLVVNKEPQQSEKTPGKMEPVVGVILEGITEEELKAKQSEATKRLQNPNYEVLPGVTAEELKAKQGEATKRMQAPKLEVVPGVTAETLRAKQAEAAQRMQDPKLEVLPGMTMEALRAKQAEAAQRMQDPKLEVLPGMTLEALRAKQAEAVKQRVEVPPPPTRKP
jgi:hypothetical protein